MKSPKEDDNFSVLSKILQELTISNQQLRSINSNLDKLHTETQNQRSHFTTVLQALQAESEETTVALSNTVTYSNGNIVNYSPNSTPSSLTTEPRDRIRPLSHSSNTSSIDRNTRITEGDEVVIIHRFSGQYGIIGTAITCTPHFVNLRTPTGRIYKKRRDKVGIYLR